MPSLKSLLGLGSGSANSTPTRQTAEEEAARSSLDKMTKLQVGQEAIFTQDLQELAQADRDRVDQLFQKRGFKSSGSKPVGDIIVCDDYNASSQQSQPAPKSGLGQVLAGIALAVALAGGAMGAYALCHKWAAPAPAWDAVYETQQPDGSWKQTRRERLQP